MDDEDGSMQGNAPQKPAPPARQADEKMLESMACQHAVSLPVQRGDSTSWPEEKRSEEELRPPSAAQLVKPEEREELVAEPIDEPAEVIKSDKRLWLGLGIQILVLLGLLALAWLGHLFIKL